MSTRSFTFAGIAIAVLMGAAVTWAQQGARGGEWPRYGADAGITKYAPLDQIDKQNVSRLAARRGDRAAQVLSRRAALHAPLGPR
jgi:glucose dehydrogenase